jgi:hypothetical protein
MQKSCKIEGSINILCKYQNVICCCMAKMILLIYAEFSDIVEKIT